MDTHRLLKVQSPALRLGGRRFGAHTFVAHQDAQGRIVRELHGIARGPGGAPLPFLGGVVPFRREVLWGEDIPRRTGFYDPAHPQGPLFEGSAAEVAERLAAAEAWRQGINARALRYPWPAVRSGNSNSYYAALLAAMGLADIRLPDELWAPGVRRPLAA
ncbi:hypothetical protein LRS10_10805 [Phenylobacterium sp. J426]|uniref:hypothetical protein n=1 Tax=Phenylobacterium sp. J426 TaxID=2898439 RepID=UPI0021510E1E|nr:hypothetical protein [Phenylobacterium sp. J426]MCR5874613.1 hypothetical protein [Phenylobacterium sp. J426]